MKLYWRYKKDGKWTWKPVSRPTIEELMSGKYPVTQGYFTTEEEE